MKNTYLEYSINNPKYGKGVHFVLAVLIVVLAVVVGVIILGEGLSWRNLPIFIPAFIPLFAHPISFIINREQGRLDERFIWGTKAGRPLTYDAKAELQSNSKRWVKLTTSKGSSIYISVYEAEAFCQQFNASL